MAAQPKRVNSDDREQALSEPHSIEGHSTVDVKTGELVWEPEEVRTQRRELARSEVRVPLFNR